LKWANTSMVSRRPFPSSLKSVRYDHAYQVQGSILDASK
jgi:hypothetical protein